MSYQSKEQTYDYLKKMITSGSVELATRIVETEKYNYIDLQGYELNYSAILNHANFEYGQVRFSGLAGSELNGACLYSSSFYMVDLNASLICQANLSRAEFESCSLHGCGFRESNLSETGFFYVNLSESDFSGAKLNHARFYESQIRGCSLRDTDLRGTKFVEVDFRSSKLGYITDFTGAIFDEETDFTDCVGLDKAKGLPQWVRDKYLKKSDVQDIVAEAFTESSPDDDTEEDEKGETK